MLNHISLGCTNLPEATRFYDAVLGALGYAKVCSGERFSGWSLAGDLDDKFSIKLQPSMTPPGEGFHLAFTALTRAAVDEFHKEALQNGGRDNGKPGLRSHYGPNYYAAFVFDLDGHPIEAVCHNAEL